MPRALITVDSRRPSLAVTWVTYWARRLSVSSTVLDRAALPVQSHREPGRWQHSPVVISGPSRRARGGEHRGESGSSLAPTPQVTKTLPLQKGGTFTTVTLGKFRQRKWSTVNEAMHHTEDTVKLMLPTEPDANSVQEIFQITWIHRTRVNVSKCKSFFFCERNIMCSIQVQSTVLVA